jgi:hypothetical protein
MVEKRLQITRSLIQANEPDLQHSIPGQMGAVTHIHAGRPIFGAFREAARFCSAIRHAFVTHSCAPMYR